MQTFRPMLLVGILVFSLLGGACSQHADLTGSGIEQKDNQQIAKSNVLSTRSDNLIKRSNNVEYRFYSPNRKHYVSERFVICWDGEEPLPMETHLFFNNKQIGSSVYTLGCENKQVKTRALWLDNNNVIINGTKIFNVENLTMDPVPFPKGYLDKNGLLNWRLDHTRKLIAYLCFPQEIHDLTTKRELHIMIYNLLDNTWKRVFIENILWKPDWIVEDGFLQIFWDNTGSIFVSYTSVDDDFNETSRIFNYNVKNKHSSELEAEYNIVDSSPEGKYLVVETFDAKFQPIYSILCLENAEIVCQLPSHRYTWSCNSPSELAAVRYDESALSLEIISLEDPKKNQEVKDRRFSWSPSELEYILIDSYIDGYVIFTQERTVSVKYP